MGVPLVGLGLLVAAAGSVLVGGLMVALGRRIGFTDRPDNDLKTHSGAPVPLGGVALMLGLHGGLVVAGQFDFSLFVATLIAWSVGLVDDSVGVSPVLRLVGAALAGLALVTMGDLVSGVWQSVAAIAVVVVAVNAVNLLDGLDALAANVSSVAAIGLATYAIIQGVVNPWTPIILAAALVGFIYWNYPPARLYLGDNGAYVIGVVLAWAALRASPDWTARLVAVALIGVPLLDLGSTVVRRLARRLPLFAGDRDHSYDRLHQSGLSIGAVAATYGAAQALWAATLVSVAWFFGDVAALTTALILGASIAFATGLRR